MKKVFQYLEGDKALWALIILVSLFSFLPVYSASSNLQYIKGSGTTINHLIKHATFIITGFIIILLIQRVNYRYLGGFAQLLMPVVLIALLVTLYQGNSIEGANASRWLSIPGIPFTFQTSSFASLVLMVFIARYLTKHVHFGLQFKDTIIPLFLPTLAVVLLIFPANGSTGLMIFAFALLLLFLGNFPFKYIALVVFSGIAFMVVFISLTFYAGDLIKSHRVDTWKNRVESFMHDDGVESYQVVQAKTAIVEGGVFGVGPGKSALKQTLSQSSSDFIFAIIVEEYGLFGAIVLLFLYTMILYRIIFIATRMHSKFGRLVVLGVGLPIIAQAIIHMAVSVNLMPVTGQPLPMISYGGTSMWVTYAALGIILNVSRNLKSKEELEQEARSKKKNTFEDIA